MKKDIAPSISNPSSLVAFSKELKTFIVTQNLYTNIQGKNYVNVEGWQFAGVSMGIIPVVEKCERLNRDKEIAYQAEVSLYNGDKKVGYGVAICSNSESKRKNADEYVIASMAQTRAVGKAYRLLIGFIMKQAGYEATPADEMPEPKNMDKANNGDYGYCSGCGQAAIMSSRGNIICPDWQMHKEKKERTAIYPTKGELEFSKSLDEIPVIEEVMTRHQEDDMSFSG